jgi:lysophospholipase L1-like esterase
VRDTPAGVILERRRGRRQGDVVKTTVSVSGRYAAKRALLALFASALAFAGSSEAAKPIGGGGGGGKTPAISVTPTSLSFGGQAVGSISAVRTVAVSNTGRANLQISSIARTGTGAASFSHTSTCPATLAPGANCAVSVRFSPSAVGTVTASLVITSNASNTPNVAVALSGTGTEVVATVRRILGGGDSIMRGYNATCTGNTGFLDLFCYSGGDQPENSFFDGSSSSVNSIVDRYIQLDPLTTGSKSASASGSEMTDPSKNNFATQANAIVSSATQPVRVFVELGGNDICNRATVNDLYSEAVWESAVRAGLNSLVNGLPDGSTVLLVSVPRVQDLRAAGIAKQQSTSGVNCQNFWASFDVCRIATADGADLATRLSAVGARQRAYNDKLVTLAGEYNGQAGSTGVEVVAEFDATANTSVGSYSFQATDINGGDCFHPSIQGQNKLSEIIWGRNPYK